MNHSPSERQMMAAECLRLFSETDCNITEIADRLGISRTTVYKYISGARTTVQHTRLAEWAKALRSAAAAGVHFPGMDRMLAQIQAMQDACAAMTVNKGEFERINEMEDDQALVEAAGQMEKAGAEFTKALIKAQDVLSRAELYKSLVAQRIV